MEITDPASEFGLNAVGAPSDDGFIQEHVPSGGIHAHAELHRAAFLQALAERCMCVTKDNNKFDADDDG